MENVKKINDELTVTRQVTPAQLQQAAQEGFKSVLNLRAANEEGFLTNEQQQAEAIGLTYFHAPVTPTTMNDERITQVLQLIDDLPKPALIHCSVGLRAGAMTMMHLATRQGMTPEQAFETAQQLGFDCSASPK